MSTSTDRDTLAGNIRAEVARQRVKQSDICQCLGLSQRAVSRRLLGEVDWSATEVAAVANLLGVSLDSLLPAPAQASA